MQLELEKKCDLLLVRHRIFNSVESTEEKQIFVNIVNSWADIKELIQNKHRNLNRHEVVFFTTIIASKAFANSRDFNIQESLIKKMVDSIEFEDKISINYELGDVSCFCSDYPEEYVVVKEAHAYMWFAYNSVPLKYRKILNLKILENYNFESICTKENLQIDEARRRYVFGLNFMRAVFAGLYDM